MSRKQGLHVSARSVTVDHRVAIRAHDCKIGESRCAGFIRLREWMKVMYVCITVRSRMITYCRIAILCFLGARC